MYRHTRNCCRWLAVAIILLGFNASAEDHVDVASETPSWIGQDDDHAKDQSSLQFAQSTLSYSARLEWIMTHACRTVREPGRRIAEKNIEVRLFEVRNGERTGETWPDDPNEVYFLTSHSLVAETHSILIRCAPSTMVCYGAAVEGTTDSYWGVGTSGERGCDDCCIVCPPRGGFDTFRARLTC